MSQLTSGLCNLHIPAKLVPRRWSAEHTHPTSRSIAGILLLCIRFLRMLRL